MAIHFSGSTGINAGAFEIRPDETEKKILKTLESIENTLKQGFDDEKQHKVIYKAIAHILLGNKKYYKMFENRCANPCRAEVACSEQNIEPDDKAITLKSEYIAQAVQTAVSNAYENKYDWFIKIGNYKVMNSQILISSYILTPSYVSFKFMPANADVYADFIKKIKENCINGKAEITAYCPNEHSYVKFNAYLIEPTPVIAYSANGIPHCEATEIVFTLQEPTNDLEMYIMMKNIQMLLVGIKDSFRKGADSCL